MEDADSNLKLGIGFDVDGGLDLNLPLKEDDMNNAESSFMLEGRLDLNIPPKVEDSLDAECSFSVDRGFDLNKIHVEDYYQADPDKVIEEAKVMIMKIFFPKL